MIVMNIVPTLAAVAVAAPLLAGCGGGAGATGDDPSVVASFYPLQYVAERVVGEHATVQNLTSPGKEPHDLELTVQQTAEVEDADIAFYQQGFQPAVDEAVEQSDPEHVVETTEVVKLEPSHAGEDESEDELAEHEGEGGNPHFWLDPKRLSEVAVAFEQEMAQVDPDHAGDYARNVKDLQAELTSLDSDYRKGLANCELDTVVVSHDAFGYLSKYGLNFEPISGLSPDAEPSPEHIAALLDLIETDGITTVFSETLASKQMSETIARDVGIETAVLDPIEGLSNSTASEDYFSIMRTNLTTLQDANRCQ